MNQLATIEPSIQFSLRSLPSDVRPVVAEAMSSPFACLDAPEPVVAERLPALIEQAETALRGAASDAIETLIGMYCVAFPAPRNSADEATLRLEIYSLGLADIPEDALSAGMAEGVKVWKFFPTVAEIREQAEPFMAERRKILGALRNLAFKSAGRV